MVRKPHGILLLFEHPSKVLKLAFLTTDNREQFGRYDDPEPYFGTAMSALLEGFALLPGEIEVHVVSCAKKSMHKPEKLASNIWFHQPLVPKPGWGRSAFVGCGLAVRRVLAGLRPDLVHAQGTERDCAVSMMFAPVGPRLLTIHGHMSRIAEIKGARFPNYYWLASHLEKLAIRRADGVVALNNYTRKRVSPEARHVWVVPNALSPSFFDVKRHVEPGLAICVAGIHPWKRQVELMEMLDEAPPGQRPRRLVFIGEASSDDYGISFAKAIAARSAWCEHTGPLDIGKLQEWIGRAEFLILPSIEDNCPMVVLEAMAAGLPVVASAIGGIPELVKDKVTGGLFDPYDAHNVRAVLSDALADPRKMAIWGESGQDHAIQHHHPRVVARQHLELYREAVARHSAGAKN